MRLLIIVMKDPRCIPKSLHMAVITMRGSILVQEGRDNVATSMECVDGSGWSWADAGEDYD